MAEGQVGGWIQRLFSPPKGAGAIWRLYPKEKYLKNAYALRDYLTPIINDLITQSDVFLVQIMNLSFSKIVIMDVVSPMMGGSVSHQVITHPNSQ